MVRGDLPEGKGGRAVLDVRPMKGGSVGKGVLATGEGPEVGVGGGDFHDGGYVPGLN